MNYHCFYNDKVSVRPAVHLKYMNMTLKLVGIGHALHKIAGTIMLGLISYSPYSVGLVLIFKQLSFVDILKSLPMADSKNVPESDMMKRR